MKTSPTPAQFDAFLSSLEAQGICISEWARSRGFKTRSVYAVLSRHHTGSRGIAREILLAMGLTPPPTHRTLGSAEPTKPEQTSFLWRRSAPQVVALKPRYRLHIDGRVELVSAGAQA